MHLCILSVFLLSHFGCIVKAVEWNYESESNWPGACRIGVSQSPINIDTSKAVLDKHGVHIRGPLQMSGYEEVHMEALNTGHTLKWRVKSERPPVLSGGPLRANYTLMQFHLHWLSEHAIDSIKYPMEIHMVHIKQGLTVQEATALPDGLAVIAVLCQVDSNENSQFTIQQLMYTVPLLMKKSEVPKKAGYININNFMSPNEQAYFTYHGSLTTPECQEAVVWIVMENPITISDQQYRLITKADVGGTQNYRSLQTSNRIVYRTSGAASLVSSPVFVFAVTTILNCMTWLTKTVQAIKIYKEKIFGLA